MQKFAILILGMMLACPGFAGVVFEIEISDHETSPAVMATTELAVEGSSLKMETDSGGQGPKGEMIFRGDRHEMIVVDHDDKSYHVIDRKAIENIAGQVNQAMSQVEETLKNLPAEQRAAIEKAMKQRLPPWGQVPKPPLIEVRKTIEQANKNGYPCVRYEVSRDGRKMRELWVTDWSNIESDEEISVVFQEIAAFFRNLMTAMPNNNPTQSFGYSHFDIMPKLDGFPVVTREFDENGKLESESKLTSSRRKTFDPAVFESPSGYKRRAMFPQ